MYDLSEILGHYVCVYDIGEILGYYVCIIYVKYWVTIYVWFRWNTGSLRIVKKNLFYSLIVNTNIYKHIQFNTIKG